LQRVEDRSGSLLTDTGNRFEFVHGCRGHSTDRSEAPEEGTSGHGRDSGYGRQRGLTRIAVSFEALAVNGTIPSVDLTASPHSKPYQPERGIRWPLRPNHRDVEVGNCKKSTTNGGWAQGAVIDAASLDQKHGRARLPSKLSNLLPEAPGDDGQVQVPSRLPLHERAASDVVVGHGERFQGDVRPECSKGVGHSARPLADVGNDLNRLAPAHLVTIAADGAQH